MTYDNLLSLYQDVVEKRQELGPIIKNYKSLPKSDLNLMTRAVVDDIASIFNEVDTAKKYPMRDKYNKLSKLSWDLVGGAYSKISEYIQLVHEMTNKLELSGGPATAIEVALSTYERAKRIDDSLKKLDSDWFKIQGVYNKFENKMQSFQDLTKEMNLLIKLEHQAQKKFTLLRMSGAGDYIDKLIQLEGDLKDFNITWGRVYNWASTKSEHYSDAKKMKSITNSEDTLYVLENLSSPWVGNFLEKLGGNGLSKRLLEKGTAQYNCLREKSHIIGQAYQTQIVTGYNIHTVLGELERVRAKKPELKQKNRETRLQTRELTRDLFRALTNYWEDLEKIVVDINMVMIIINP